MKSYHFKYRTTASDLWQLSMYGIYGSMLGVVNIIFTIAMLLLTLKFFEGATFGIRLLLLLSVSLFSIIQPLSVFLKAKKQARGSMEIEIDFDDRGVHIKSGDQSSDLKWQGIKGISKKPTLVIVRTSTQHGFVLRNQVLKEDKSQFYEDVRSKIS